MNKKLLMLYGAAYAVSSFIKDDSKAYARKDITGKWQSVDWFDIYDFLTDLIEANKEKEGDDNES